MGRECALVRLGSFSKAGLVPVHGSRAALLDGASCSWGWATVAVRRSTCAWRAAMADGSVKFVAQGLSRLTWWYALTAQGGDILGSDW